MGVASKSVLRRTAVQRGESLDAAVAVKTPTLDVSLENHGSIVLLRPLTDAAKLWISEKVSGDALWFGGAVAVEPRFVGPIVEGLENDGLVVG